MIKSKVRRFFESLNAWSGLMQTVVLIVGLCFTVRQISDVRNMQSAELMLKFNDQISSGNTPNLILALEKGDPIFVNNGGKFLESDVDRLLNSYELLSNTYTAGLISNDMVYNGFSYDIVKAHDNKEVRGYLQSIRRDDGMLFMGFDGLAEAIKNSK